MLPIRFVFELVSGPAVSPRLLITGQIEPSFEHTSIGCTVNLHTRMLVPFHKFDGGVSVLPSASD